jgi:hypothetical protein
MSQAATFVVTLRTHCGRAYRRLARTLRTALRRDQLRAIDARELHPGDKELRAGIEAAEADGK